MEYDLHLGTLWIREVNMILLWILKARVLEKHFLKRGVYLFFPSGWRLYFDCACRILIPQPRIEPVPPALRAEC